MYEEDQKAIVFTSTKQNADELAKGMRRAGFPALVVHGDKSQSERDWVLRGMLRAHQ